MDALLEQASQILDQALLAYAGGQLEAACEQIAAAAALLHEIQLAALPQELPAAGQGSPADWLQVLAFEAPLALPAAEVAEVVEIPVTAIPPPGSVKSARESSVAVAA